MKQTILITLLSLITSFAYARKDCTELKTEIEAKLKAKGVVSFQLEIVNANQIKDEKVVGSCDGGAKKITYLRK